jgi:hypothetical protein
MSATAYPLAWPENMPRTKAREKGQFRTALPGALSNVRESLNLFGRDSGKGVGNLVISSNVTLGVRAANPWVVAYTFRRIMGNIDAIAEWAKP